MIAAVRRLERAYPCHRAQAALQPIAEAYAGRWQRALERSLPLPDVFDLIQAAVADRVPILAAGPLLSYIDRCAQDRRVPEPHRIVLNFVHGYILTRHPFKAKCRCHAPLALPSPQPQPTSPDAAPPPPPPSFPRRREPRRAYAHPQQTARRTPTTPTSNRDLPPLRRGGFPLRRSPTPRACDMLGGNHKRRMTECLRSRNTRQGCSGGRTL